MLEQLLFMPYGCKVPLKSMEDISFMPSQVDKMKFIFIARWSTAAMSFAMKWYKLVQIYIFALKVLFCENIEAAAATILATYATIFAFCHSNIHRANLVT